MNRTGHRRCLLFGLGVGIAVLGAMVLTAGILGGILVRNGVVFTIVGVIVGMFILVQGLAWMHTSRKIQNRSL